MERDAPDLDQLLIRVRKLLDAPPTIKRTTPLPSTTQPTFGAAIQDVDFEELDDNEEYSPPSSITSSPWASPRQTHLELEDADLPSTKPPALLDVKSAQLLVKTTLLNHEIGKVIVDEHAADSISLPLKTTSLLDLPQHPKSNDPERARCDDSDDSDEEDEYEDEDGAYGDAEDSPSSSDSSSPSTSPIKPGFAFPFHQYTQMGESTPSSEATQQKRTLDDIDLETKAGVFRRPFSTLDALQRNARHLRGRSRGVSTSATSAPPTNTLEKQRRKWYSAPNLKPGVPRVSTRGATIYPKPITFTTHNVQAGPTEGLPLPTVESMNLPPVKGPSDDLESTSSSDASGSTTAEGTLSTVSTSSGIKVVYKIRQSAATARRRGQIDGPPEF